MGINAEYMGSCRKTSRQVVERNKASMKILLIFFALSVALARRQKFCPKEKPLVDENDVEYGDKCVSEPKNFKCGAFFENLKGKKPKEGEVLEVQWLGAIPDALDKTNSRDIEEIFGEEINKKSFGNLECKEKYTNSRCFTILKKFSSEPLDSCSKTLVNTKGTETVGDYLCKQVKRWLKRDDDFKANGKNNIKIAFLYSHCGGEWTAVKNGADPLYTDESLCCTAEGLFERCNGKEYKDSTSCVKPPISEDKKKKIAKPKKK